MHDPACDFIPHMNGANRGKPYNSKDGVCNEGFDFIAWGSHLAPNSAKLEIGVGHCLR